MEQRQRIPDDKAAHESTERYRLRRARLRQAIIDAHYAPLNVPQCRYPYPFNAQSNGAGSV